MLRILILIKIKRRQKDDRKTIMLSIRISPKIQKWLMEHDYSPTGIFYEAIRYLGYKQDYKKKNDVDLADNLEDSSVAYHNLKK